MRKDINNRRLNGEEKNTRAISRKVLKDEKRRTQLAKQSERQEARVVKDEDSSVMVVVSDLNRRIISAFLALVFVLTSVIIGYNLSTKAVTGDMAPLDGTYTYEIEAKKTYTYSGVTRAPLYRITLTVTNGFFTGLNIELANAATSGTGYRTWNEDVNNAITWFLTMGTSSKGRYVNAQQQILQQPATENTINAIRWQGTRTWSDDPSVRSGWPALTDSGKQMYATIRDALLEAIRLAPGSPKENIVIDDDEEYIPEIPPSAENSIEVDKNISFSPTNQNYDLNLSAYSTAELGEYEVVEKIPTDFIIIVDQSGSMAESDMPTSYKGAGNKLTLEDIAKGNYYYMDSNGDTYRVFAEKGYLYEYFAPYTKWTGGIVDEAGSRLTWFQDETEQQFNLNNTYYFRDSSSSPVTYRPINVFVEGKIGTYYMRLSYKNASGTEVLFDRTDNDGIWYKPVITVSGILEDPLKSGAMYAIANTAVTALYRDKNAYTYSTIDFGVIAPSTGMYINYPMYKRHVGYTRLCYRDKDGNIQTITTDDGNTKAEYCTSDGIALSKAGNSSSTMKYSGLLEAKTTETRLKTLNTALKDFAKTLQAERDSFGPVDNKISIVGFSSLSGNPDQFENTELLTGVPLTTGSFKTTGSDYYSLDEPNHSTAHNGTQYNDSISNETYNSTLLSVNENQQELMNAINAVTAYGGTQPEYGFKMAKRILESRDTKTYELKTGDAKGTVRDRNQVVIFFTDGEPGNNYTANRYVEANKVVSAAKAVKDYESTYASKPTVYSIGVFGNADGEPLKYWANEPNTSKDEDAEYKSGWFETVQNGNNYYYLNRYWLPDDATKYGSSATDTIYDYMSVVSSNYPDATGYISDAWARSGPDDTHEGESWTTMLNSVRGDAPNSNEYYRMAANQESLINAFRNAARIESTEPVTMEGAISENSVIKDVIDTSNFAIPTGEDGKPTATVTIKKQLMEMSEDGVLTSIGKPVDATGVTYDWDGDDKKTLVVKGFDFNKNYIAYGKPADSSEGTGANQGYQLLITISDVSPTKTGENLTSNKDTSGIYSDNSATGELLKEFPVPAIARHKYTLNVGDVDNDATFNVDYALAAKEGVTPDFNSILVSDATGRQIYSTSTDATGNKRLLRDATNGNEVFFEYITANGKDGVVNPDNYNLTATVTPTSSDASTVQYYLSKEKFLYNGNQKTETEIANVSPVALSTLEDGNLYVTSKANNRTVTIKEKVDGSFSSETDTFTPTLYLVPPSGTTLTENATYDGVTWTLDSTNNRLTYTPNAIQGNDTAYVSLTVPSGWTLQIAQTDENYYDVTKVEYVTDAAGASTNDITETKEFVVTDNSTVTITNIRSDIPVTGIMDTTNPLSFVMYIAAGIFAVAAIVAFVYSRKKRTT